MQCQDKYELTINNMTGKDCLAFLEAIQSIAFNFEWHLHGKISENTTHNIYLELATTLEDARAFLTKAASSHNLPDNGWRLLPTSL